MHLLCFPCMSFRGTALSALGTDDRQRPPDTRLYEDEAIVHKHMPPEPTSNSSAVGHYMWDIAVASDMWSLGAVMLSVFTSRDAFYSFEKATGIRRRPRIQQRMKMFGLPSEEVEKEVGAGSGTLSSGRKVGVVWIVHVPFCASAGAAERCVCVCVCVCAVGCRGTP